MPLQEALAGPVAADVAPLSRRVGTGAGGEGRTP